MRTIVGIDPGKYTGLVAILESNGSYGIKDQYEATNVDEVIKFINQHNPEVLIIEDFIANGGRCKDFTALEVIAVIKYVIKRRIKITMQSPSCQANIEVPYGITSRHCESAMKHIKYYLEKEKGRC